MALILDTNAVSALAEGDPALDRVITGEKNLAVPVIALGEYLFGIRHSRHRARYEQFMRERLGLFMVLNVDAGTGRQYAEIRSELKVRGNPIPSNDVWIAALARQYGYPLLSRDRHFDAIQSLRVIRW